MENKPKVNKAICIRFFLEYTVICAVPLVLSFALAWLTSNIGIDRMCTFQEMLENHLENGLFYGILSMLGIAAFSYFLFWKKIEVTWRDSIKRAANIVEVLSLIVFISMVIILFLLPLKASPEYIKVVPSTKVVYTLECISIILCSVLQCFTHPDVFLIN